MLAAGCGKSSVTVSVPSPSPAVAAHCARLGDALPQRLESLRPRVTTPRTPLVHAWGTPAIVLACGVGRPAGFSPRSSETTAVNGVRWFEQAGSDPVVWTAVGLDSGAAQPVFVQLTIPASYTGQGAYLVDLAPALRTALAD